MFFFYFCSTRVLRAPAADRHETLPHDVNLGALYDAGPTTEEDTIPTASETATPTEAIFDTRKTDSTPVMSGC